MDGLEVEEIPFADGNVTGAVRVGSTVRRGVGPWTPAIHPLLAHLERVGFAEAPRVLGLDERGREILTYVEGETSADPFVSFHTDESLATVARLLRQYHDATLSFLPASEAPWRFQIGAPRSGDVICHNDIAPWNTVVCNGRVAAFIDWDFATPGPRIWDIAHAIWRFVPLYEDPNFGTLTDKAHRIRMFCDAYGLGRRDQLLDMVARRQRALRDSIANWAAAGEPAFVAMLRDGHANMILNDIGFVERNRNELSRGLTT